ncbi:MAG: hypothetical protein HY293_09315, partial [Planctomycetes bacterium]|nr:hypothetical protein [Planctomycetota bacterium]
AAKKTKSSRRAEQQRTEHAKARKAKAEDLPTVGKHDWYGDGAKTLVEGQKADGSWVAGGGRSNSTWDSCYAILFLKKATQRLEVASEDRKSK